ncbi:MAG: hypothetical protein JXR37_16745 [Kiritimatiellae bacterium]|nr:hypothetical protein [Kiritimatiellia bacterium]
MPRVVSIALKAFELLLLGYTVFISWRILGSSFARNMQRSAAIAVGMLASGSVQFLAARILPLLSRNVILCFVLTSVLTVLVFFLLSGWLLRRVARRYARAREARAGGKGRLPRAADRALCVLLMLAFWAGAILVVDFMANLAALSPIRDPVCQQSLILRYFIPAPPAREAAAGTGRPRCPDGQPEPAALGEVMARQAEFLGNVRQGWTRSKDFLAEKAGTQQTLAQIAAMVELLNLPEDESAALIEKNAALRRLRDNAAVQRVLNDDRILALVIRISEGSLSALYQIGEEPSFKALLTDAGLRETLAGLDLAALCEDARRNRRLNNERATTGRTPATSD